MSAEYLLHCSSCNEYTSLGRYVEKEGRFQGEYSLLHNRHLNGDDMLCRFLIRHTGHPLTMHANRTEAYSDILKQAHRFMEGDIDAYLEQVADRREQQAHDIQMERGLGRLQLYILREMLAKEAESLSKRPTQTSAESQFLLGKEEGVKRAQAILEELMEKTDMLYK
ncbi:hypothetical protein LJK88_41840 [Paenibacillus sp. P26]|nr:hypothetical protein LJK88_41840 [Paenibacillus sp. P26]